VVIGSLLIGFRFDLGATKSRYDERDLVVILTKPLKAERWMGRNVIS